MIPIKDHPNYLVSEFGEVYSNRTQKFLKPYPVSSGYLTVWPNEKRRYVHRLVAETYVPNPENKPQIDHIDGDLLNNHYSNLRWVTAKENCANRTVVRSKQTSHTLTYRDKLEILSLWRTGEYTQSQIAKQYNVHRTAVNYIVNKFKP